MNKELNYLKTLRNPMNSDSMAYLASIDDHRRIWGQYRHGFGCSFYIVNGDMVTELHLTAEGTEALRLVIEKLQNEMSMLGYVHTISTQAHSPKKKTPTGAKKAGSKRKTKKRPSLAKKK